MEEPNRYGLLASAVSGRRVAVVKGEGPRSFTDGETIFVADLPEHLQAPSVIAQAALLAIGSLEPAVMLKLAGRSTTRLRYLTVETSRAAAELEQVLPRRTARLFGALYAGTLSSSPQQSLAIAQDPRARVPEAPAWLGTIKPIKVLRAGSALAGGAPTDKDLERPSLDTTLRELDDEEDAERSRILELFSAPLRNPVAELIQKFFGMGRSPGEQNGGGQELPVGGISVGPVGPNAKPTTARAGVAFPMIGPAHGYRYPEWDCRARAYRPDHCFVAEFDPPPGEGEGEREPLETRDPRLRRELARLGLSIRRHRREPEGEMLDLTALIELCVDRATGHAGEARVYELARRTGHDLGVLVLLDATGSTGEASDGCRVFDEQRLLAARMTAAFEELGDRVATYAFYSRGREAVRFLRIKDFDDRYDHGAERRLRELSPGGYTRLGAAIRHGTRMLAERAGTSQQLLVLVGDGLPYEEGYEHRYAQEDSRRALDEAVEAGVACACLSVRSSVDADVIERVWGNVPHRRLADAEELRRHVRPLLHDALRRAAANRRTTSTATRLA